MEGVEDVHYDLPGIRLGLRQFLELDFVHLVDTGGITV
jgi:hypothetical protein